MTAFTIAPIGTCRIHTRCATPWVVTRSLQLGRNYGFVHTSTEALQQARYMFGQGEIPADVQRLIFRPSNGEQARRATHKPADLYMVELSSRKLLTIDGHPIQSNYLARYFSEFFADRARTRLFWSMASADRLAERRAALEQDAVYKSLTPENRELLARIVKRDLTDDEIEQEMRQLVELLGRDKVVFVTHVNAMTPDNVPIEQREQLIAAVVASSQRIGVPCYDPTPLMNKLGQAEAMEDGGLDLTHYTPLFAERLYTDWYKTFMRPRMSASAPQPAASKLGADGSAERIEKLWDAGELREASRRLRDVLRRHPGLPDHTLLFARIQEELGDYEGSLALLDGADGALAAGSKAEQILMRNHFKLGRHDVAYSLAAGLLGDEIETRKSCASPRSAPAIWATPTRRWATGSSCSASHRPTIRWPRSPPTRCSRCCRPAATWTRRSDGSMKCARPSPPCARLRDAVARPPDRRRPRGAARPGVRVARADGCRGAGAGQGSVLARLHHGRGRPGRVLQTGRERAGGHPSLAAGAVFDLGRGRRAGPG